MYDVATKVLTAEERAAGVEQGREMATYYGHPMFVSWREPPYPDASPWIVSSSPPVEESDNPAGGKVINPKLPLGWVHPDWEQVAFGKLPLVSYTAWADTVPPEVRYAWGEEQRTANLGAKTEYFKRTVKAANMQIPVWIGVCRGAPADLSAYPEVVVDVVVPAGVQ